MKRRALVLGASVGIGHATAQELLSRGWDVVATARRPEDLEALRRMGCQAVGFDVRRDEDVDALVAAVGPAPLDAVVNNIGIGYYGAFEDLRPEHWKDQFQVNVFGSLEAIRRLLPALKATRGRIVHITSVAGIASLPLMGAYCASKWALEAAAHAMRVELRRFGVRVVIVGPGTVDTEFAFRARESLRERVDLEPSPYRDGYAFFMGVHGFRHISATAQRVAIVVRRALERRRPRSRYGVGLFQSWAAYASRWIPAWLRDRLVRLVIRV